MNINDIMAALGILSAAAFVVCAVLYFKAYQVKSPNSRDLVPGEKAAMLIGLAMAIVWTIALWPTMTGSGTGAYVVYVNGVASSGGVVNFFNGFVPFFIFGVALIALPRAMGYGIHRLRESGKSNAAGKRSVPALVVSIIATLASWIFLGTGISLIVNRPQDIELPGIISVFVIGGVVLFFGIRGIVRFARAK